MAATRGTRVPPGMRDAARARAEGESWIVKPSSMDAYTCVRGCAGKHFAAKHEGCSKGARGGQSWIVEPSSMDAYACVREGAQENVLTWQAGVGGEELKIAL